MFLCFQARILLNSQWLQQLKQQQQGSNHRHLGQLQGELRLRISRRSFSRSLRSSKNRRSSNIHKRTRLRIIRRNRQRWYSFFSTILQRKCTHSDSKNWITIKWRCWVPFRTSWRHRWTVRWECSSKWTSTSRVMNSRKETWTQVWNRRIFEISSSQRRWAISSCLAWLEISLI